MTRFYCCDEFKDKSGDWDFFNADFKFCPYCGTSMKRNG
jgi:hypothetical protein